jgi:hypothetical protein
MKNCCQKAYIRGQKQVYLKLFGMASMELGYDENKRYFDERAEVITKLRDLCEEHGDNDWPDNLHLSDIIEKHLL